MAQAMIEMRSKKKTTSTQTGDNLDFTFLLSKTKTVRMYKSRSYKDYVLSLSLNRSKKLIITKSMWKIFKIYVPLIDKHPFIFKHPFTCTIAGPTQSGKTSQKRQSSFDNFNEISPDVKFHKGIPDIDELDTSEPNLIILDDLMKECEEDPNIQKLFTIDSHHKNISFFMEAFEDAASKPHGYLLIDLKQSTEERNRIQTGITSDELRIIYTSKD
ncbi:unnamed protein product [Brachionus calyciflorus]|uniref:Uncharacterized protein n=1 Tax=Brachionus calyciflorus TaxID=104777 RepID=A0A814JNC2_9BILA|nr:unnamed protein product [Brachionus calyciflorus]